MSEEEKELILESIGDENYVDFKDWYNVMGEELNGKTPKEIVNMYLYFEKNKL